MHSGDHRYINICGGATYLSRCHRSRQRVFTILYTWSSVVNSLTPTPIHTTCLTHELCTMQYILRYRLLLFTTFVVLRHSLLRLYYTVHSSCHIMSPYLRSAYHPCLTHTRQTARQHIHRKGIHRRSLTSNVTPTPIKEFQIPFILPSSRYYITGHKGLTAGYKGHVVANVARYYPLTSGLRTILGSHIANCMAALLG